MSVGDNIIYLRSVVGMTADELGQRINMNRSVLSRIENNERKARADEILKIADVLGVTVDFLLGRGEGRNSLNLPQDEVELMIAYRLSPQAVKNIVDVALKPYRG